MEPKEFMILKFCRRELKNVELTQALLKIILTVSDMEPSLTVEEVLDFRESLCYIAHLKTSEMLLYSQETLKE